MKLKKKMPEIFLRNSKILIVCSHPDDEILGCGGLIAKFSMSTEFNIIYLTNGGTKRKNNWLQKNMQSLDKIKKQLKIKNLYFGNFPDNQLDTVPKLKIIQFIEGVIQKVKPNYIFTHNRDDLNIDHRLCSESCLTASRPMSHNKFIRGLFYFETLSSSEWSFKYNSFNPNFFLNISNEIRKKINLIKIYKHELKKSPHPRSIEIIKSASKVRGSTVGYNYAEAFEIGFLRI